jgi:hypothetical protein
LSFAVLFGGFTMVGTVAPLVKFGTLSG